MSEGNPLPKAHALSAHASLLLRTPHPPLPALEGARDAYNRAADLFTEASATTAGGDEGAKRTLGLLVSQNRKLAKDVERRIAARDNGGSPGPSPGGSRRASASGPSGVEAGPSTPTPMPSRGVGGPTTGRTGVEDGAGIFGLVPSPSPASSTAAAGGSAIASASTRSIPPFALRPSTVPRTQSLGSAVSTSTPDRPTMPTTSALSGGPFGSSTATSPLYSSSSSSEPNDYPYESYVNFGALPDQVDPFSRFWARLDNMLDDISNPVKFAMAMVAPLPPLDEEPEGSGRKEKERSRRKEKSRERGKRTERTEQSHKTGDGDKGGGEGGTDGSPSGSYYLVQKSSVPIPAPRPPSPKPGRNASPSSKTPEELALENEHLRASLDALAVHSHAVEEANKALQKQVEERERMMRSVVVGVRREAQKAKQGAEVMRSQLLQQGAVSPRIPAPPDPGGGGGGEDAGVISGLRRRVRELEEENSTLRADNEKQKSHVAKYKERFEKIKVNARAKKAAREGSADHAVEGQ